MKKQKRKGKGRNQPALELHEACFSITNGGECGSKEFKNCKQMLLGSENLFAKTKLEALLSPSLAVCIRGDHNRGKEALAQEIKG